MAARNSRSTEEVRRELESERERLAQAVDTLRAEVKDATDVGGKLRRNLPVYSSRGAWSRLLPRGRHRRHDPTAVSTRAGGEGKGPDWPLLLRRPPLTDPT